VHDTEIQCGTLTVLAAFGSEHLPGAYMSQWRWFQHHLDYLSHPMEFRNGGMFTHIDVSLAVSAECKEKSGTAAVLSVSLLRSPGRSDQTLGSRPDTK
jgi:hypothetical protein